jgi:hypothetical protein
MCVLLDFAAQCLVTVAPVAHTVGWVAKALLDRVLLPVLDHRLLCLLGELASYRVVFKHSPFPI